MIPTLTIGDLFEAVEQLRIHTAALFVGQIDLARALKVFLVVQMTVARLYVEHLPVVD